MARKKRDREDAAPESSSRLTPGKEKNEELIRWRSRVLGAQRIRKNWETKYQVEKCERYILGDQKMDLSEGAPIFNNVLATLKIQEPSLFLNNPKFFVNPRPGRNSDIMQRYSAFGEGVLQSIGAEDDQLELAGDLAIFQSFSRIGVLKVCYDPLLEPNPQAGNPIYETDEAGNPILDRSSISFQKDPLSGEPSMDPNTGQPIPDLSAASYLMKKDPLTGEPLMEPNEIVTDEAYKYQWIDANDMLLPDEGPDRSRWSWIGEEIVISLEEAKENSRFREHRAELKSNETTDRLKTSKTSEMFDKDSELFRYYECYDIKKKKLYCFADGQDFEDFLSSGPLPDGIEDHPYALLSYDPILGPESSSWPLPHIFPWLDPQREYNVRRQQITEGAKRSARKVLHDDGTFADPDEAVKALQSSKDMEAVKVQDVSSGHVPKIMEEHDLNQVIYKDISMLQSDWRIITGQTGARLSDPDTNTATEATFVEKAANLRDLQMQKLVGRFLSIAGKKMFQLVKATLTLDMYIKLRGHTDKEFEEYATIVLGLNSQSLRFFPGLLERFKERFGQEKWIRITRETLQFEADVSVVPGSARPQNAISDQNMLIKLLGVFGQYPQLLMVKSLTERVLRAFDVYDATLVEELMLAGQKWIEVNARQAGRTQPVAGENGAAETENSGGLLANMMAGAMR